MVTGGVVPSPPPVLAFIFFITHRVQQSRAARRLFLSSSVANSHALALSASHFVSKKKFPRVYATMHSEGLELVKLTCTRLEDNLIRHRGDRQSLLSWGWLKTQLAI